MHSPDNLVNHLNFLLQEEDMHDDLLLVSGEDRLKSSSDDTENNVGATSNIMSEDISSMNRLSIG